MNNNNNNSPQFNQYVQQQQHQQHQQPTTGTHDNNINLESDETFNYFNFMSTPQQQVPPNQQHQQHFQANPQTTTAQNLSTNSSGNGLQQMMMPSIAKQNEANSQTTPQRRSAQFTVRVNNSLGKSPTPSAQLANVASPSVNPPKATTVFNTNAFSSILSPQGNQPNFGSGSSLSGGTIVIGNIKFPANPSLAIIPPQMNPQLRSTTPTATSSVATPEKKSMTTTSSAPSTPATPVSATKDGEPKTKSTSKKRKRKSDSPTDDSAQNEDEANDEDGKSAKKSASGKKGRTRSKTCKRWTEAQNRALREAVLKFGPRNWKKIAAEIGGMFTADQCNQRWHRVSNPRIIKGDWTPEEDDLLFSLVQENGESCWTKVAEGIPGRTDIQCRHRFFQRKKEIEMGVVRTSTNTLPGTPTMTPTKLSGSIEQSPGGSLLSSPSPSMSTPTPNLQALFQTSSPKVLKIDNNATSAFLIPNASPNQVQLPAQQQALATQQVTPNEQLTNEDAASLGIKDYRKYSRHFTNYGKRSGELSSDMSNFSYVEEDCFSDDESSKDQASSSSSAMDIDLFAKEEDLSSAVMDPASQDAKRAVDLNADDEDEQGLEIDMPEESVATQPANHQPITAILSPNATNTGITAKLIALSKEAQGHNTPKNAKQQSDPSSAAKKQTLELPKKPVSVNRMRGNLNVHIPWSESEEVILKKECLSFGQEKIPDFARILTEHSQSFHPLHTPDVLRKHYLQLKAAAVDFTNPVDSIPPDAQYFDEVLESELGLINVQKKVQPKKERKKKEPKEKKPRKKKEEGDKPKKEKKATTSARKRKIKDISDEEVKSSATDRFVGKKKPTGRKKARTDEDKGPLGLLASATFGAPALSELAQAAAHARSYEEQSDGTSNPQTSSVRSQHSDNAAILLNFSQFVSGKPPTDEEDDEDDYDEEMAEEDTLESRLLANPSKLKPNEKNVTFRIAPDPSELEKSGGLGELSSPYLTTSNKLTILEIGEYLREKFDLDPKYEVIIWMNGKIVNNDLRLENIIQQSAADPEDLELLYESK